jgi:TolB-like protein/DNA-binding winged helix-turn-helix (wHTH) protein
MVKVESFPFRLGDWLVQPSLNRISRGETTVTLELKVMQVLVCLAENKGDVVTRQYLTEMVWATEFISDNTVTHAITELRNALDDDAKNPTYIETIHRRGYRLVAPVQLVEEAGGRFDVTVAAARPRWPHVLAVVIAAVIGLLVILPPEALFQSRGDAPEREELPRIVVLPFENLGPPDDEYFADGVTEEIISRLSNVSGLRVVSRTSSMYFKDRHMQLRQIGEELNVEFVLEGTIRWDRRGSGDDRVRITPQLIQVAGDAHLWGESYDRVLEDILAVQPDIAEKVVEKLEDVLSIPGRHSVGELIHHPKWDPLRDHPRFQALLERYEVEQ